jgi:hypothetical protein
MSNSKNKLEQLAAQGKKQAEHSAFKTDYKVAVKASFLIYIGKQVFPKILLLYPFIMIGNMFLTTFMGNEASDPIISRLMIIASCLVATSLLFWPLGWLEGFWLQRKGSVAIQTSALSIVEKKKASERKSIIRRAAWNSSWLAYLLRPTVFRLTILSLYIMFWIGVTISTDNYYKYFREGKKPFEYYYRPNGAGGRGKWATFDPEKSGYGPLNASISMGASLALLVVLVPIAGALGWRNYNKERAWLKSLNISASGYPEALGLEPRHLKLKLKIFYKSSAPDAAIVKSAAQALFKEAVHSRSGPDLFDVPIYSDKFDIYITKMYKFYRLVHRLVESIHSEYPISKIEVEAKEN